MFKNYSGNLMLKLEQGLKNLLHLNNDYLHRGFEIKFGQPKRDYLKISIGANEVVPT